MSLAQAPRMPEPARPQASESVESVLEIDDPFDVAVLARIARRGLLTTDPAAFLRDAAGAIAEVLPPASLVAIVDVRGPRPVVRGSVGWGDRSFEAAADWLAGLRGGRLMLTDAGREGAGLAEADFVRDHRIVSLAGVAGPGGMPPRAWILAGSSARGRFDDRAIDFLAAAAELVDGVLARDDADATRARAHAALEEEAAISRALLELGQTLHAHLNDPYLLDWVNTAALRLLRSDWSGVLGWDVARGVFQLMANAGKLPAEARLAVAELRYTPEEVPRLRKLRPGELLEVASLDEDPVLPADLVRELHLRAALCTPVACSGEVLGIHIHGWRERPAGFRPRHRHLVTGIAHATAVALETALLVADLQTASRLKSEFLANVSHELRTPINIVAGYTEMLADGAFGDVPDEAAATLDRIRSTTRSLSNLVATTLHLGRLEAGRDAVDVETFDVHALLAEVAAEITPPADVSVRWPAADAPLEVTTDRSKLRTIAQHLSANAVKFTERGSVDVDLQHDGHYLTLTVHDTGIGIAEEYIPMIFKPFAQIDGSNTRRHGGVGLGLHVVKRFVGLLHGDVRVSSRLGEGSSFVVTLPAPRAA